MHAFDQDLGRRAANFTALSPVAFVERSAEVFGDLPAVVHGARSARLAAALRALGVGRLDTVSVMLPNTPEMVEAHYAVPALNAVLNTLNTRLDAPLLAWQMAHCEARVLITDREFAPVVAQALRILKAEHGREPVAIANRPTRRRVASRWWWTSATASTPGRASAWARSSTRRCSPPTRRCRAWKARPTSGTPSP